MRNDLGGADPGGGYERVKRRSGMNHGSATDT
jgi:hypothetical protein